MKGGGGDVCKKQTKLPAHAGGAYLRCLVPLGSLGCLGGLGSLGSLGSLGGGPDADQDLLGVRHARPWVGT